MLTFLTTFTVKEGRAIDELQFESMVEAELQAADTDGWRCMRRQALVGEVNQRLAAWWWGTCSNPMPTSRSNGRGHGRGEREKRSVNWKFLRGGKQKKREKKKKENENEKGEEIR